MNTLSQTQTLAVKTKFQSSNSEFDFLSNPKP